MTTLTIFANFYINDSERFLRLQDSFRSFKDVNPSKWVINARGKFKYEVLSFLKENVGDKLIPYTLESKEGWFADSKVMLKDIDTDYVFVWLEDHMNIAPIVDFKEILDEMKESQTEYVCYSWWVFGKINETYADLKKIDHKHISTFVLDKKDMKHLRKYTKSLSSRLPGIISQLGILSLNLFRRLIINSPGFFRWHPKHIPNDFEKLSDDTKWLPINYAILKHELFCSIDDDLRVPGSSLQSRGLYPVRELREKGKVRPPSKWRAILQTYIGNYLPEYFWDIKYNIYTFRTKLKRSLYFFIKGI